jgi:hypothetical protein
MISGVGGSVLGLAALAPGVGSMGTSAPESIAQGRSLDTLPECPHDWELLPKRLGGRVSLVDGFALPGEITNVPEFHDCQKLILVDSRQRGGLKYGPLVAVFAAYDLAGLERRLGDTSLLKQSSAPPVIRTPISSTTRTTAVAGASTTTPPGSASGVATLAGTSAGPRDTTDRGGYALAGALILNTSLEPYEPLNIKPGFSCLYLWRGAANKGTWRAMLVFVDTAQSKCVAAVNPAETDGVELSVRRDTVSGFERLSEDHYPPVARWDWDSTHSVHYIGLKCGKGWCEVGRKDFVSARAHMPATIPPTHVARVQRIKGWYDEQLLAEPEGRAYRPGSLKGTIFPSPELQAMGWPAYTNQWVEVGYVALNQRSDYYKKMLNLDSVSADAPLSRMNIFSMCYGTRAVCLSDTNASASVACGKSAPASKKLWWMRIKAAGSTSVIYRCVTRRDHEHLAATIPGTARWRWLAEDETVWEACIRGCCEVEVGHS